MEIDGSLDYIDGLFSDDSEKWLSSLKCVRNSVIGNSKQKMAFIDMGIVPRLLMWMLDDTSSVELRRISAVVLGSLARGSESNIDSILEAGSVSVLIKGVLKDDLKFTEACLCCLRTLLLAEGRDAESLFQDKLTIPHLINILPRSDITCECVISILTQCCQTYDQQISLVSSGILPVILPLLNSTQIKIKYHTLRCISSLCFQNEQVCQYLSTATCKNQPLINVIVNHMARDQPMNIQLAATKCLAFLFRSGLMKAEDPIICLKTLPALVRFCHKEYSVEENVDAAKTLAYLIEENSYLQKVASITDHCIATVSDFTTRIMENPSQKLDLLQSMFLVFASLASNDEEIRKKVMDLNDVISKAVDQVVDKTASRVTVAALRCLQSFSRSVQQLRTSFHCLPDAFIKTLLNLVQRGNTDVMMASTGLLCNLLLELSPAKAVIIERGVIYILIELSSHTDPGIRVNAMWCLMNAAYVAPRKLKSDIMEELGIERLFRLVNDSFTDVIMKTLGLLRNLFSFPPHIDHLMPTYGKQIMHTVVLMLEGDYSIDVKEQTLCVLVNIADGPQSREFIIGNEDVMKKIVNYLMHNNLRLQMAAVSCVINLLWNEDEADHATRHLKLKEHGVQRVLHQLQGSVDPLHGKVLKALEYFSR